MIFTKRKGLIGLIVVLLLLILIGFAVLPKENFPTNIRVIVIDEEIKNEQFDYYESNSNSERASITAYKSYKTNEFANVNFGETSSVRVAYSLEYDYSAEIIYVAMSTFNDKEELVDVELLDAYPIYYDDGTFDALVAVGDNTILLSELQAGVTKDCFVGALVFGSIAFGKLLTGLLIGAGAIVGGAVIYKAVEVAVKSGWFTYQTKSLTEEKVKARTKTATKYKGKKNPDVYYLAELYQNKLCINSSPWSLQTAKEKIRKYGNSFWTPKAMFAIKLASFDGGPSYNDPDLHSQTSGEYVGTTKGMYYHYHPKNHKYNGQNVHIWYGSPIGEIF